MMDGDVRGGDDGLRDVTYDGVKDDGFLSGGLGQLTDGDTGHTNFLVDSLGKGTGKAHRCLIVHFVRFDQDESLLISPNRLNC